MIRSDFGQIRQSNGGGVASELGVKESYQHAPKRVNQGSGEADVGSLPNNITLLITAVVAKFSSTRYGIASTRFNPGIVKEIVLSSAASAFACSAVSSTSGGRTFAHAGSFA